MTMEQAGDQSQQQEVLTLKAHVAADSGFAEGA